jgi:hypothetical protein
MKKSPPAAPTLRADLIRAGALALLVALLWCAIYDRWTAASWQTPLAYISEPEKGDVIGFLAQFKAAQDGNLSFFSFMNVPQLGAPFVANWDDFPIPEKTILIGVGLLARIMGLFAAANFAVMLAQVLAALGFYAACRLVGAQWFWAFSGGLVFAFARYAFAHGLHHLPVTFYWHVPLCLVVVEWIFRGAGLRFGERRFLFALGLAVITGVQNVYYTNLFAQFLLLGGLVQAWRHGWRAMLPALAIIGTCAGVFVLMNLNTFLYHIFHGGNPGAVARDYHWLEIYGLKLVDLVMPPPDHPVPFLAAWGANHLKEIVLSPGEMPPSGYLGVVGLAALAGLTLLSLFRTVENRRLPLEAWLILWTILYATVGGLNSIGGVLGFNFFRATTRYSIFILCLVLMYAVRRLSLLDRRYRLPGMIGAGLVAAVAIFDQTPPWLTNQDVANMARDVASDRDFTGQMEKRLPPNAMVFQLPVMSFPESPAPGVGSYDHFRPYLYARQLRFSFGTDKGRPAAGWTGKLAQLPLPDIVKKLEAAGFAAIYVNRAGFPNLGADLIKQFQAAGFTDMIQSDRGDLVCIFLQPSPNPVLPDY